MTRDRLTRMDVDTGWAYHRKLRKLQRLYPEQWPTYWAAYMTLLGEAWAVGSRKLTLEEAWCPAMPCTVEEAEKALRAAAITDTANRVPIASWRKWYEPAARRITARREAGKVAAEKRWHPTNGKAMPTHNQSYAPRQPASQPSTPSRARVREEGLTPLRDTLVAHGLKPELAGGK